MESTSPPPPAPHDENAHESPHDGVHGHPHLLSELQEEVLCWTIVCFVVVAIAFGVWTQRVAARAKKRRVPTKRRARRKLRR